MSSTNVFANVLDRAASTIDLTASLDQERLLNLAEALLSLPELSLEELRETARFEGTPLEFKVAAKLAESRRFLERFPTNVKLGIVFGMWGEQNRLRPCDDDNPNGEDSLRTKLDQLAWVTRDTNVEWTLYPVDDGCPHGSAGLAEKMAAKHPLRNRVKVMRLSEHLPGAKGTSLEGLESAEDSRKGGAVICGAQRALEDGVDAVIVTDADNSVHMAQIGLLLQPYLEEGFRAVLGTRKHGNSVLVKQESRWGVGIGLLRHMQRMVGSAIFSRGIRDTQAAFKLYDRELLAEILSNPVVFDFSVDTDWIAAVLAKEEPYTLVPFAFIDSFAESASITQGPMTTWETLLMGLMKQVRERGLPHNEEMARVLEEEIQSSKDLDLLIDSIPPELDGVPPRQLGDPKLMSPRAVQDWIRQRKSA